MKAFRPTGNAQKRQTRELPKQPSNSSDATECAGLPLCPKSAPAAECCASRDARRFFLAAQFLHKRQKQQSYQPNYQNGNGVRHVDGNDVIIHECGTRSYETCRRYHLRHEECNSKKHASIAQNRLNSRFFFTRLSNVSNISSSFGQGPITATTRSEVERQ